MKNDELLALYLEKLRLLAEDTLKHNDISVIEALKASITYLEGEMQGY